ncbi:MAG: site-specific DNA-methyltransferase [Bacillota bacterium]
MTDSVKMDLRSQDLLGERIQQLKELFPEVFTEGKVDFNRLKQALGENLDTERERYGLSWAGKSEAIKNIQTQSHGTLLPVPEESVNFDSTENLIIEGDNLEVLKLLQKSYHGKVKMIYIDPPYNTGKEFIYPDNFREGLDDYLQYSGQLNGEGIKLSTNSETDGRYHSKWLTMMYPRLFLARNLLKRDGIILVSIDDHEMKNLQALMDEIFGEENHIGTIVWRRSISSNDAERHFSNDHEYILAYGRSIDSTFKGIPKSGNEYSNPDNDPRGPWKKSVLVCSKNRYERPNLYYPIQDPKTGTVYECNPNLVWAYEPNMMKQKIEEGRIIFPSDPSGKPSLKLFWNELRSHFKPVSSFVDKQEGFEFALTSAGSKEISEIFGGKVFLYPKPTVVISKLVEVTTGDGDIILDFFAGSGTTAHAVLNMNSTDGANRKFILVQLPEPTDQEDYPTIADITKERVLRVISKLNDDDQNKLDFDGKKQDRGFRVFKLTSSNFKIWDGNGASTDRAQLEQQLNMFTDNLVPGRKPLDILCEILLKAGYPLTSKVNKVTAGAQEFYAVDEGLLLICLEKEIQKETLQTMRELEPVQVVCLDVAFQGNDQLKTNTVLEMKSHKIIFHTV